MSKTATLLVCCFAVLGACGDDAPVYTPAGPDAGDAGDEAVCDQPTRCTCIWIVENRRDVLVCYDYECRRCDDYCASAVPAEESYETHEWSCDAPTDNGCGTETNFWTCIGTVHQSSP